MTHPAFDYRDFTTRNIGFVTEEEQEILRRAKVFVAGVGGMGGAAVACLVRAGVGHVEIADMDTFEVSNMNRQMFATLDTVGVEKTEATRAGIARINPECEVTVHDGRTWTNDLDTILPRVDVAINGCDDVRATLALMRNGKQHARTVIDAFASTLPNVYVVRPDAPRPEDVFGYPTAGVAMSAITDEMVKACARAEIEWVMTHSSTADHVVLERAAEMVSGKRKRISFAPMVWMTGCLMAYEAVRVILKKPGGPDVGGVFFNPWTGQAEHTKSAPVAAVRRFFVRKFLDRMTR
jgi:molybdopterin/thiamine biosynthesis adenylyltransferase